MKKRTGIAPPNKPFKTLLPRRSKLSNQDFIRLYKAAWKTTNPIGFDIERKVLIDPPSRARLIEIREIQSKIITDYGELNEVECMRRCVPTEVIFRPELLDTRIDFSFQQLLRAIENECWPNTESDISALADSTDGIIFTNNGRVQKLTESFENSALGVDGVPRAVARESIGKSEIGRVVKPNLIARAS